MDDDNYFQEEGFSPVKSILGLLTFSTILPINVYTSIEYMTRLVWCWPFVHLFVGFLALIVGVISQDILHFNALLTSIMVYGFLMIITGYNHIDGVMDMADGVMVHGDSQKKINVMKDSSVGAGGIATLFIIASLTISCLYNVLEYDFIMAVAVCEMLAKTSLLTTALMSKPLPQGIGSYFISSTNIFNYLLSTVIVAIISFILGDFTALSGVVGAVFGGTLIAIIAERNFGIANGDVLGMSNEAGRLFALLFMIIYLGLV